MMMNRSARLLGLALVCVSCRTAPAGAPSPRGGASTAGRPAPRTVAVSGADSSTQAANAPRMLPQNPSPMQERTRTHERLLRPRRDNIGVHLSIDGILPAPVEVFIPQRALAVDSAPLLIHFMSATWLPQHAATLTARPIVVAAVFLGNGSSVYKQPFAADSLLFGRLVDSLRAQISRVTSAPRVSGVYLSSWSAGYAATREILRRPENLARIDGVLMLEGMLAGYVPDGTPLANGGAIDTADVMPYVAYAKAAVSGSKRFLVAHTEIFPGTYASSTESADWLLDTLGLKRTPVLEWGPMGTQLLSRTQKGRFELLGFAGNSAPDHVDLLHGLATFVDRLLAP